MRTTLDLPDPIFRDLKVKAAQEGLKLKDLVERYIVAGLQGGNSGPANSTRARSPLPVFRTPLAATTPSFSNAELQEILDEEDASGIDH